MTKEYPSFYINGSWVEPAQSSFIDVINPATEEVYARIAAGNSSDVDKAVASAKAAFPAFSQTSKADRIDLLTRIIGAYEERSEELAQVLSAEMGAPIAFARDAQVAAGKGHLQATLKALSEMEFEEQRGQSLIIREAIGVVGLITPWNWILNQVCAKVAPAIAAGCTMVLKPSEVAPVSGTIFAEIMEKAGTPKGVFNLINGDGPSVGQALAAHPDVDMISFTGSTRAGIIVAKTGADTVKRISQELGGKSPNIILPDADLVQAVTRGVYSCFSNSGQSCNAPTRMLVPAELHDQAVEIAKAAAAKHTVGDPTSKDTMLGPVVSEAQYNKIQGLIEAGIKEATLVTGGPGRPAGLGKGYFVRPTIFAGVNNNMTIAREEIFGPVLAILPYKTEEEAIAIANDTVYGLSASVESSNMEHATKVARQIRAGQVRITSTAWDVFAPFGGYKQSGNGREFADWGIHEFLEVKALVGNAPTAKI